jgi:hypothetical protein
VPTTARAVQRTAASVPDPDGVGVSANVASASMSPSGSLGRPQHLAAGGFVALGEHEVASAAGSSGPTGGGISMSSRLSPARAR